MKQVSLRMPAEGYRRLVAASEKWGVTFHGFLEAATMVALVDDPDPARRALKDTLWPVMQRLQVSPDFRLVPKRTVNAKLDDDLVSKLAAKCRQYDISLNVALCLIVTPWPEEDRAAYDAYRAAFLPQILTMARQLDRRRRNHGAIARWGTATELGHLAVDPSDTPTKV